MQGFLKGVASRLSIGVATAIVTTVVVAGGLAYASQAENVPNNSVTTSKIRNNAVTSAKIRNNTIRSVDLHPSVRNQLGVPGPQGPAGPAGPAGPPGPAGDAARYAHVDADSTGASLITGRGVSSVNRLATGQYRVNFSASAENCGLIATLTDNSTGVAGNGEISAERDNATTVRVRTYNSAGAPEDRDASDGFTLLLAC